MSASKVEYAKKEIDGAFPKKIGDDAYLYKGATATEKDMEQLAAAAANGWYNLHFNQGVNGFVGQRPGAASEISYLHVRNLPLDNSFEFARLTEKGVEVYPGKFDGLNQALSAILRTYTSTRATVVFYDQGERHNPVRVIGPYQYGQPVFCDAGRTWKDTDTQVQEYLDDETYWHDEHEPGNDLIAWTERAMQQNKANFVIARAGLLLAAEQRAAAAQTVAAYMPLTEDSPGWQQPLSA